MRHRKKGKKLGRTSPHRKRTLQALSNALIENKQITTTVAKAKALRPYVEPLITRAKEDTEHNRREVFRYLQNKETVHELFGEVSERVGDRPGGYTRIIQLGKRSGDGAELALVELVDYNDVKPADAGSSGGGGTRRGSGKGRRDSEKTDTTEGEASADVAEDEAEESTEEAEASVDEETDADEAEPAEGEANASADSDDSEAEEESDDSDEEK